MLHNLPDDHEQRRACTGSMSLARTIRHVRTAGLKKFWRDMQYIGDPKAGTLVGTDALGNKYYEDLNEIPGRHRWVDYARHDVNVAQLEPVWHAWLHHIRSLPPTQDPIVEASRRTWELPTTDSVTGSRASFRTYDTVRKKINAWEPKIAQRK